MNTMCLLIDDDADDQEVFQMALNRVDPGIECIAFFDCMMAIERLNADQYIIPAFIFLDINMPKMDGLQCLREIRRMEHLKHVTIIMYSTTLDDKIRVLANEYGASGFLVKQFSLEDLVKSLSKIFGSLSYDGTTAPS